MSGKNTLEPWTLLKNLLQNVLDALERRKANSFQKLLIEFIKRGASYGYGPLSRVAKMELRFFKDKVLPGRDEGGYATLSFSLGALLEKMQQGAPGPRFDSGLSEVLSFLDSFEEREAGAPCPESGAQEAPDSLQDHANHPGELSGDHCEVHAGEDEERTGEADYVMDRTDWYKEVLREDPSSILFCDMAEELCSRGLWQDAARVLREGLNHHPRHIRGYALLGWALWEFGSAEEAEKALTLARQEIERCAVVYRVLGEILTHRGSISEVNRLEKIHSLMKEGVSQLVEESPPSPSGAMEVEAVSGENWEGDSLQTEPADVKKRDLMSFLDSLRDTLCSSASPPRQIKPSDLFTDDDRMALEKLIRVHSGHL